jgi:hypothetical protein
MFQQSDQNPNYAISHEEREFPQIKYFLKTLKMLHNVRFQVLNAASMNFRVFWDVAPRSIIGVDRRFRGVYCLHQQGDDNGGSTRL